MFFWSLIRTASPKLAVAVCLFVVVPFCAHAQVIIAEIAWMGSETSANDEWIELHNTGSSAVAVDGWTLIDDDSLDVSLSGSIPASARVVLERTDDSSALGSAFLIYTGALSNGGATLTLRDDAGSVEDEVVGGENWENIGGDNDTKETPQLRDGVFITASPTPGAPPPGTTEEDEETDTDTEETTEDEEEADNNDTDTETDGTSDDDDGPGEEISLEERETDMKIEATLPSHGYVGQPVRLSAEVSGVGTGVQNSVRYTWNYGDGRVGVGKEVVYTYAHSGTYIVSARAAYHDYVVRSEYALEIREVPLSLSREDGVLRIANEADYRVNVSRMHVQNLGNTFTFPDHSFISAGGVIVLSAEVLGFVPTSGVALYDREGSLLVSEQSTSRQVAVSRAQTTSRNSAPPQSEPEVIPAEKTHQNASIIEAVSPEEAQAREQEPETDTESTSPFTRTQVAYLLLVGVLGVGIFGLYARRLAE